MVQNYIMDKLTLSDLKENGKVVIPNFQRGVVWTKQHRKDFIETVKTGDPFGVVLVYQGAPGEPYYLIDGLQRLSTLKAYMDNPLEFIDENDKFTDQDMLSEIFKKKYEIMGLQLPSETKLSKEKKMFLKKTISLMKKPKTIPSAKELWPEVSSYLGLIMDNISAFFAFSDFYDSFNDNLKLPDIIIHAIVYQGAWERLPYVFETLNTSSVSLSKYEVFASQWPFSKIIVNDEEMVGKVWSKYENLKKSSTFNVEVDVETIRNEGMTLFEYCFGFSELINDQNKPYSVLFSKGKKTTDPTGFELLALACGLHVNKADILWKDEYLGRASGAFLVSLKDALINSISVVYEALKNWITDIGGTVIKNSSTYQIYYMIITVFNHLYSFDPKNKVINKKDGTDEWVKKFKKNASKWYLYQIMGSYWNQHRQVGDLTNLINDQSEIDYTAGISKNNWVNTLDSFFNTIRENGTNRNISDESRLFLNYYYRLMIEEDANRGKFFERQTEDGKELLFDIEHIVPVAKFQNLIDAYPISAIGNLCYLAVKDNRSKRDHTIYEYALDRPALTFNENFLEMIDYPAREELTFINCKDNQFGEPYEALIKKREERISAKFVNLITM